MSNDLTIRARLMLEQLIPILVNSGRTKKIGEVEALIEEMKKEERRNAHTGTMLGK